MLKSMGLQRAGHDLVSEQQHPHFEGPEYIPLTMYFEK